MPPSPQAQVQPKHGSRFLLASRKASTGPLSLSASLKPLMERPSRLKHRCTAPGSWQSAGSSIMPRHVVLAHWLTRLTQSQHWPTVSVGKLKAVNGVPLSPQAQVPPKHGSRMLAVSWQFDHAEACGPRSLAYSPHAKPALAPCLCRQVKSRQWSAPLASSTGATEARIFFPHSKFDTCYLEMRIPRFLSCLRWEFRN